MHFIDVERISGGMVFTDAGDDELTAIYVSHYPRLIRAAMVLLDDECAAEDVVQDAYIRVLCGWDRIRDRRAAARYLRTTVVNLSRSQMRHRMVAAKYPPEPLPDVVAAEESVLERLEREHVRCAVKRLPRRQRQCLTLRYYGNLSEPQIAAALGISVGAVKSHTFRGINAMRRTLGPTSQPRPQTRFGKPHRRRAAYPACPAAAVSIATTAVAEGPTTVEGPLLVDEPAAGDKFAADPDVSAALVQRPRMQR